jgi:predicted outer membrane repeat protein
LLRRPSDSKQTSSCSAGNIAAALGGAVSLQAPVCVDVDVITLTRVSFVNNTSGGEGGGLYLSKMSSTNLNATDLLFEYNEVGMLLVQAAFT